MSPAKPSDEYLDNVVQQLYSLTLSTCKIPLWIGEFGGLSIDLTDTKTLHSLAVTLDLFDRCTLGRAFWSLAETDGGPRLIDGNGKGSPFPTSTMIRISPSSFAAGNVTFMYSNTPRFQLRASTDSSGTIEVSVPTVFQSTVPRCIDCVSRWNNDQHSLIIEILSNKTTYFYLDAPGTISQLEKPAESEFEQALQISDEPKTTVFHSPLSREHVREIDDVVDSMQSNLTAKHYELVLHKLDRLDQLRILTLQQEDNYTSAEAFVNSVKQDILTSQGFLSKWRLLLLSQA